MKYSLSALALLLSVMAWSQKTTKITKELGIKRYEYRVLKNDESVKHGKYQEYINDNLREEGEYDMGEKVGTWEFYSDREELEKTIFYQDQEVIVTEYKGAFRKEYSLSVEDETKDGYCKEYIEDELVVEGKYDEGHKTGTWIYYLDGEKYLEESYDSGNLREQTIYREQKPYSKQSFQNGQKNGWYFKFYESGDTSVKKFYADGKLENYTTYFTEDGTISFKGQYKNGQAEGIHRQYYDDGTLRYELSYQNDNLHGDAKYYYDNGNLMVHFNAKEGLPVDIVKLQSYKGEAVERDDLLKSGNGLMLFYHDNGALRKELNFKDGKFHGEQKAYFSNGDLDYLENYTHGEVNGKCESYYSNGLLDEKGEVINGYKVGAWQWHKSSKADEEMKESNYEIGEKREYKTKAKIHNAKVYEGESTFSSVESMPEFPGGMTGMQKFIVKNVTYPTRERENNIEGLSLVTFVVDITGEIIDVEIFDGTENKGTPAMHKESKRMVNDMPRWIPGFQMNIPVKVKYTLPIRYKLK